MPSARRSRKSKDGSEKTKKKSSSRFSRKSTGKSRFKESSSRSEISSSAYELDTLHSEITTDDRDSPKDVSFDAFGTPEGLSPTSVVSKDGQRIITAHDGGFFPPSALRESFSFDPTLKRNIPGEQTTVALSEAPTAREAAYSGPPRYDWIDVETAAALKIQSIVRRNEVITMLEEEGKLTPAMRNRRRARNSKVMKGNISDDVPICMKFCGVGYLFGEYEEEDEDVLKQKRIAAYEEKKRQKQIKEEEARKYRWRNREMEEICEGYEVVEEMKHKNGEREQQ